MHAERGLLVAILGRPGGRPASVELVPGFTRDVSGVGHHGTGDLEVRISSADDLARAMPLLQAFYEAVA